MFNVLIHFNTRRVQLFVFTNRFNSFNYDILLATLTTTHNNTQRTYHNFIIHLLQEVT